MIDRIRRCVDQFGSRWYEIPIFTAIMLVGAFFRFYQLDQLPPGLQYDEAFNARMAEQVLTGVERPIFFREANTEEPMLIYFTALSFVLFGASPFSLALVVAFAGTAGIAALYALARDFFPSRWTAALAACILATLYWHVHFSRFGIEPIFTPLMMTLCLVFLWRALKRSAPSVFQRGAVGLVPMMNNESLRSNQNGMSSLDFALAGLFFAATQYTYKAALFFPFLVALFLVIEIAVDKTFWVRHRRGLAQFIIFAFLGFGPLGTYFVTHSTEFLERPSMVVVASPEVGMILENTVKVGKMFFCRVTRIRPAICPTAPRSIRFSRLASSSV